LCAERPIDEFQVKGKIKVKVKDKKPGSDALLASSSSILLLIFALRAQMLKVISQ